jgi:hypothetical protein
MRYLFLCALALFLCTCAPSPDGEATTGETMEAETTETDDEGWEILFDGDDVDKWRGYNRDDFPNQGWRVENGELMVEYFRHRRRRLWRRHHHQRQVQGL